MNVIFTCVFIFMLGNRNYLRALGRAVADLRLENAELKKIVLGQSISSPSDKKTVPSFNRHDFFPCADKAHFFAMDPKLGPKTELRKHLVIFKTSIEICNLSFKLFTIYFFSSG